MPPELIEADTGRSTPICVDCGDPFSRSEAEIAARRGSGMAVSPRCPACRDARRAAHNAHILDLLRHGDVTGKQIAAPGTQEGGDALYPADCSSCQRPIRLPFKPSLDRPVFCRFCRDARSGR